jgi:phosphatidylglycerophosphate synthase
MSTQNINVPNGVSALRIGLVPVLFFLAWKRLPIFTALLAATLLMDILDGLLARVLRQQTPLGARLDSWGDFLTVLVYPYAAYWLRPQQARQIAAYAVIAVAAYVTPVVFGFLKFRRLTSYHTRLMTVAAYVMGAAMIAFFADWSSTPFKLGCFVLVAAEAEEMVITAILPRAVDNVAGLGVALRIRRQAAALGAEV